MVLSQGLFGTGLTLAAFLGKAASYSPLSDLLPLFSRK